MRTRKTRNRTAAAAGLVLGGALALGFGGALGAGLASSMSAEPTAVGTIDLNRLLDELQETKDREGEIQTAVQARLTELQTLSDQIQAMMAEVEGLPEGEQNERIRLSIEIAANRQTLQARDELYSQEQQQLIQRLFVDMAAKAIEATRRVAERDGYDIVLHDNAEALASSPGLEPVLRLLSRNTIYSGESVDLTNAVITLMNNEYAAGG